MKNVRNFLIGIFLLGLAILKINGQAVKIIFKSIK